MAIPTVSVVALAEAVADGTPVDWTQAASAARTPADREAIRQLRRLAGIGRAARTGARKWGPLEIRGEIGRGAFGIVYGAWDPRLERAVALKLLRTRIRGTSHAVGSAAIAEGRLLARITHPNIVTVYGGDVFAGRVGIWMELIAGQTLRSIVRAQGPFSAHEAAIIGRDLCSALAAVHGRGVLHRDLKAENVMREAGGRIVLMDFGASVAAPATVLRGTPLYLAPEVLAGRAAPSVQSDLYALGVLLYFLVSGEFPVIGACLEELRARHTCGDRVCLQDHRPELPAAFLQAVDVATATHPADRPASAGAMARLLDAALRRPRRSPVVRCRRNEGRRNEVSPAARATKVHARSALLASTPVSCRETVS